MYLVGGRKLDLAMEFTLEDQVEDEYHVLQEIKSPSRRDYQLRSCPSNANFNNNAPSPPLSPWIPRSQFPSRTTTFHYQQEQQAPRLDRSYFSGPLPSTVNMESADFFSHGANSFHVQHQQCSDSSLPGTPEVGSSRHSSSPERDDSTIRGDDDDDHADEKELAAASHVRRSEDENCVTDTEAQVLYSSTHEGFNGRPVNLRQVGRPRNCVSGELGLGFNFLSLPLPQRSQTGTSRRCASGEIGSSTTESAAYPDVESDVVNVAVSSEAKERCVDERSPHVSRRRPSATIAWDTLNELKMDSPRAVAVPFTWEEAPGKAKIQECKKHTRTPARKNNAKECDGGSMISSSSPPRYFSRRPASEKADSRRSSNAERSDLRRFSNVERGEGNLVLPAAANFLRKGHGQQRKKNGLPKVAPAAIPFKWEEVPGKSKFIESKATSEPAAPSLQLPPRLSSTSRKNDSFSSSSRKSNVGTTRARKSTSSASLLSSSPDGCESQKSSSKGSSVPSLSQIQKANSRHTISDISHSGPLEDMLLPSNRSSSWQGSSGAHSGPLLSHAAHFGLPQYRSAELQCGTTDGGWQHLDSSKRSSNLSSCSPTSTLYGPGHGNGRAARSVTSSSTSEHDNSRSHAIVPYSNSYSSTSYDSLEQWSHREQASPTSRRPSGADSGSPYLGPIKSTEEPRSPVHGAMIKLCEKLKLKSKSKPGASPILWSPRVTPSPPSFDLNGDYSHGEEYFDCRGSNSSSPAQDVKELEEGPPTEVEEETRLPYKMPPTPPHMLELARVDCDKSAERSSATDFSNCLGVPMPKFLSKGETAANGNDGRPWVDNPHWDPPTTVVEDGYRSPAYRATLDLLSPSDELMAKRSGSRRSRSLKLSSASLRKTQSQLVVSP